MGNLQPSFNHSSADCASPLFPLPIALRAFRAGLGVGKTLLKFNPVIHLSIGGRDPTNEYGVDQHNNSGVSSGSGHVVTLGYAATLFDAIQIYNHPGANTNFSGTLDPLMKPLNLERGEIWYLVAFLESLTADPLPPELIEDTSRSYW